MPSAASWILLEQYSVSADTGGSITIPSLYMTNPPCSDETFCFLDLSPVFLFSLPEKSEPKIFHFSVDVFTTSLIGFRWNMWRVLCMTHGSIHFLVPLILTGEEGSARLIPAGLSVMELTEQDKQTSIHLYHKLEEPINLKYVFVVCGRRWGHPEGVHTLEIPKMLRESLAESQLGDINPRWSD